MIAAILKPQLASDTILLQYLNNPTILFVFELITAYSLNFELPFLKKAHNLDNCTVEEYEVWMQPIREQIFFHLKGIILNNPPRKWIQTHWRAALGVHFRGHPISELCWCPLDRFCITAPPPWAKDCLKPFFFNYFNDLSMGHFLN